MREAAEYFERWPADDVRVYAAFGGIPYCFTRCDPDRSLRDNICEAVLSGRAPLREEPERVLQAELRAVGLYGAVLEAIASGATKLSEIAGRIPGLTSATELTYYLRTLQDLHIVRREVSLDRRDRRRERNARYHLDDYFMMFWYYFVLPNLSALQSGFAEEVYDRIIAANLDTVRVPGGGVNPPWALGPRAGSP